MWMLQVILCVAFATRDVFSLTLDHQTSIVRTKRQVDCRRLGHSIWSSWGPCYPVSYGMERRRYRLPRGFTFKSNVCPKIWEYQECKEREITVADDTRKCKFSEWSDWDDCKYTSATKLYKERHRIVELTTEDGLKCSEVTLPDFTEAKECVNDCSWTTWTSCYKYETSRGVIFDRYRTKESKNLNCRYKAEFQGCYYCEWAEWTSWGPCQKDTKEYQRRRRRARQYSNSENGKFCSLLREEDGEEEEKCIPEEETTPNPSENDNAVTIAQASTFELPIVRS